MNFKPILFSTEMVKAILSGSKVQTRRVVKPQPDNESYFQTKLENGILTFDYNLGDKNTIIQCPYGQVGDVLWVREKIEADYETDDRVILTKYFADKVPVIYSTNDEYNGSVRHWTSNKKVVPSIHMPKEACRLFLKIKSIRVERLKDISEEDAASEGIEEFTKDGVGFKYGINGWHWSCNTGKPFMCRSRKIAFEELWQSINGEESWNSNPWVWVIEFERIEKPESQKTKSIIE